ncbi:MAG TPA: hypothetical protein VIM73_12945, partial [Polyangiaceae bacterium]
MHLTINLLFSTLVFALAARLFVMPRLETWGAHRVLPPILLLHAMRHLGLMFLAPGAALSGLPAEFAYPAAVGDLLAALLALAALAALLRRSRLATPLLWLFNLEGSVDLLAAITLANVFQAAGAMGAAYWIPSFWVPALLVTHYVVFVILLRHRL